MGMRLFYVTVFAIFFWGGIGVAIGGLLCFLRGVWEKLRFSRGVFVVKVWWIAR
jgi:hypothetical protein